MHSAGSAAPLHVLAAVTVVVAGAVGDSAAVVGLDVCAGPRVGSRAAAFDAARAH